jgi:hypothetical protein
VTTHYEFLPGFDDTEFRNGVGGNSLSVSRITLYRKSSLFTVARVTSSPDLIPASRSSWRSFSWRERFSGTHICQIIQDMVSAEVKQPGSVSAFQGVRCSPNEGIYWQTNGLVSRLRCSWWLGPQRCTPVVGNSR